MQTPEEYQSRHAALLAKFDAFYATVKDLPGFESAGIGFLKPGDLSVENMGFVVQLHKDADLKATLSLGVFPQEFQQEPVKVVNAPTLIPEGSGTRPIKGGVQVAVEKSGYGTLGGVGKRNSDGKAVLVSNHHVFYGGKGNGDPVYQPGPSCCNSYEVGKNVLGIDGTVDAAIAEASVGVTNDIDSIGTIVGTATATCGQILQKTGAKTGYTKGVVTNVQLAPPIKGAITVCGAPGYSAFTQPGDSGSFYVNMSNQVVGLHNSGNTLDGIKYSYGANITNVVNQMGITIPNPDLASATLGGNQMVRAHDGPPDFGKYEAEANKSVNGRAGLQLIKQYFDEVRELIHHDRAVTVVWIDNKGPQFGQAWQNAQDDPKIKLPKTVDGVTLDTLLNNMADVLIKRGSPGLATAIQTYRAAVLAAVQQLDSVQDLTDFVNGNAIHCFAVRFFWSLLWDSSSEFFLPAIAKNGLKDPSLGIDISPFSTIVVGDIPEVTMFDEPALGYMKLTMTDTRVSGLDTVSAGDISCADNPDGSTTMRFGLNFGQIVFSGNYSVSAGGGIGGCAIAGAAEILGGGSMADGMLAGGFPGQSGVDQALWYRQPLGESSNGRTLIGAYYDNQDAIVDLQQENGGKNPYMQSLTAADVKSTTDSVSVATTYYQKQQQGMISVAEAGSPAPTIGSDAQYNSGQVPYAYMIAMARAKVRNNQDPDGRFARLADSATQFIGSIGWYKSTYPGEQPIGGSDGVLARIAAADPKAVEAFVLEQPPFPVRDPETDSVVEYLAPKAFDTRRAFEAYHRHAGITAASGSTVNGTFADTGLNISFQITMTLSGNMKTDPLATVSQILSSIGEIKIQLHTTSGWWPGLFDKVSNWIANNDFFLGILKTQIQRQLEGSTVKNALGNLITGAMKKLG